MGNSISNDLKRGEQKPGSTWEEEEAVEGVGWLKTKYGKHTLQWHTCLFKLTPGGLTFVSVTTEKHWKHEEVEAVELLDEIGKPHEDMGYRVRLVGKDGKELTTFGVKTADQACVWKQRWINRRRVEEELNEFDKVFLMVGRDIEIPKKSITEAWVYFMLMDEMGFTRAYSRSSAGEVFPFHQTTKLETPEEHPNRLVLTTDSETIQLDCATGYNAQRWRNSITEALRQATGDDMDLDPFNMLFVNEIGALLERYRKLSDSESKPPSRAAPPDSERRPFFVISIDGGGCKGIVPGSILVRLCEQHPGLLERADAFAGTSIGSVISACLALGLSAEEVVDLLTLTATAIFSEKNAMGVRRARYGNVPLRLALREIFGELTLGEMPRKVLFPTWQLVPSRGLVQHSFRHNDTINLKVADAVTRSASAPIFFPSFQNCSDGGLWANNPSAHALTTSIGSGISHEDIVILSISCGQAPYSVPSESDHNWGATKWAVPLMAHVLWDGPVDASNYHCEQLLGERFHRVDLKLKEDFAMDDPSKIPRMAELAAALDLEGTHAFLAKHLEL